MKSVFSALLVTIAIQAHTAKAASPNAETAAQCQNRLAATISAFQAFEQQAVGSVRSRENLEFLLPWLADNGFEDAADRDFHAPITIGDTSAAVVALKVKSPSESTHYTRFEDFRARPRYESQEYDFRISKSIVEICAGATVDIQSASPVSTFHGATDYLYMYKFDVIAQANLFTRYANQAKQNIAKVGQSEYYRRALEKVDAAIAEFRTFAVEKRKAGLL